MDGLPPGPRYVFINDQGRGLVYARRAVEPSEVASTIRMALQGGLSTIPYRMREGITETIVHQVLRHLFELNHMEIYRDLPLSATGALGCWKPPDEA